MTAEYRVAREGHCRCGRISVRITRAPMFTAACHCLGCQRMSSSAFSLTAAIPSEGFQVVRGEPVIGGVHGDDLQHFCCGYCMSWMFTRVPNMPFVNVRPTMFDEPGELATPFLETYTKTKLPWATTCAVHRYDTFPPMDTFAALLAEYAKDHVPATMVRG